MVQWLRAHLVPHRMWAISLVLLAVRLTLGVGLLEPGKAKLYTMADRCAEDPLPDCERDDAQANCAALRATQCQAINHDKLAAYGTAPLFGHAGWQLPGGGKLQLTLAALIEALGGLALLLGVGARLAAVPAAGVLALAMATSNWATFNWNLTFTQTPAFLYLLLALVLAAFGPGGLSVDGLWTRGAAPGKAAKSAKPAKTKK